MKKDAEVKAADIGAQADKMAKDARQSIDKADAKFEQYKNDAEKRLSSEAKNASTEANKAIDQFDKKVTEVSTQQNNGKLYGSKANVEIRAHRRQSQAFRAGSADQSREWKRTTWNHEIDSNAVSELRMCYP